MTTNTQLSKHLATHSASKRGRLGQRTVHAVFLSGNENRIAVPVCGAPHFYWDTLHDAYDEHTGQLSAQPAVRSSWGCKRCQTGLNKGSIHFLDIEERTEQDNPRKVNNNGN